MMSSVVLDTDIFSEIIKKKNNAVMVRAAAYLALEGRFTMTAISVMEVLYGFHPRGHEERIKQFL